MWVGIGYCIRLSNYNVMFITSSALLEDTSLYSLFLRRQENWIWIFFFSFPEARYVFMTRGFPILLKDVFFEVNGYNIVFVVIRPVQGPFLLLWCPILWRQSLLLTRWYWFMDCTRRWWLFPQLVPLFLSRSCHLELWIDFCKEFRLCYGCNESQLKRF